MERIADTLAALWSALRTLAPAFILWLLWKVHNLERSLRRTREELAVVRSSISEEDAR